MNIKQSTLPNGLTVMTCYLPGLDSAAVAVMINSGSRHETVASNGVAHFLEHMTFKGTATRSGFQIGREVEKMGATVNAYTSHNETCYHITGLSSGVAQSVAILGDMLTASTFDEKAVVVERDIILQEIRRSGDDPLGLAYDGYGETAYPDQPLGRPILGRAEFISRISRAALVAFQEQHYVGQNMVIVAAGNIGHASFVDLANIHFSSLPRGAGRSLLPATRQEGGVSRTTNKTFEQVTMLLGLPSVTETDVTIYAHRIMARALGGGMSSPLFQEVREKRGLAYQINAYSSHGPDHGDFFISAGTTAEHVNEMLEVTCRELARAAKSLSEDDVIRARNWLLVGIATAKERPLSLAQNIGRGVFERGYIMTFQEQRQAVELVTLDDVRAAIQTVISTRPTIALVGPVPEIDFSVHTAGSLQ